MEKKYWRSCGSCKKEIGFNTVYQTCSVSSCSKTVFCSVDCWDMHNPVMNHKSSWAEESTSPKEENSEKVGGVRRMIVSTQSSSNTTSTSANETEILVVVSKVKQYIKDKYDMNTSGSVMDILSNSIRIAVDHAAQKAKRDGRKTIMDRDF